MLQNQQALHRLAGAPAGLPEGHPIEVPGLVEVAVDQSQFDLQQVAQQSLAPGSLRQLGDGLSQQRPRPLSITEVERQLAGQGLPLGDQFPLAAGIGLRQEAPQRRNVSLPLVEPATDQQRPGIEQDQTRRTAAQGGRQLAAPLQQQGRAATLQQVVISVTPHQAGRHFRLPGLDRTGQRRAYLFTARVPLAGFAKQRPDHSVGQLPSQQGRQKRLDTKQPAVLVDRFDEQATLAQLRQHLRPFTRAEQLLAQFPIKVRKLSQAEESQLPVTGQLVEHLAPEVVHQPGLAGVGPGLLAGCEPQQEQTRASAPTPGALQQLDDHGPREVMASLLLQCTHFVFTEGQLVATQLEQTALQQETRQLKPRAASTGDPPAHLRGGSENQLVE
ncbi:hypothetical protein D3C80_930860 [compost metagenome]